MNFTIPIIASVEDQQKVIEEIFEEYQPKITPILIQIKTILNEIFGPDFNQIQRNDLSPNYNTASVLSTYPQNILVKFRDLGFYKAIIHFPKIEITNGRDAPHTIEDLFVALTIRENGGVPYFRGKRSTFSIDEYRSQYGHSHMDGNGSQVWASFCTGHGPINQSCAILSAEGFDPDEFRLLCYNLKMYVKHESIEGVPYIYYTNIGGGTNLNSLIQSTNRTSANIIYLLIYKEFLNRFNEEEILTMIRSEVTSNSIKVRPTLLLSEKVFPIIYYLINTLSGSRIISSNHIPYLVCNRQITGRFYSVPEREVDIPTEDITVLNFKDRDIKLKIQNPNGSEVNIKKYAHPEITDYICNELSISFTKKAFRFG